MKTKGIRVLNRFGLTRLRTIICCSIFLLAATIKLFSPSATAGLRKIIFGEISQDTDYKEVFSVIGETLSSKDKLINAFDRIYVSVFGEEEISDGNENIAEFTPTSLPQQSTQYAALSSEPGETTVKFLMSAAKNVAEMQETEEPETETYTEPQLDNTDSAQETISTFTPPTITYDYADLTPPDGVELNYVALNIDYTLPVQGTISSKFGYRLHPLSGEITFHNGLDIAANEGDTITCFADGYVRAAGEHSNLGKYLIITHENGVETIYGHLNDWLVTEGSTVTKGQPIALVGQTGAATGPHLHLEIYINGVKVNPLYYFDL